MQNEQPAVSASQSTYRESDGSNVVELDNVKRLSREQLSFLPAALEIEAAPPAPYSRIILWAIMLLLMASIVWVSLGEIDITATANGKLVPMAKVKTVQPLNAGIVKAIYVQDGQRVKKGDVLLTLDGSITEAEIQRLQLQLDSVRQDILRSELLQRRLQLGESLTDMEDNDKLARLSPQQIQSLNSSWQEFQAKQLGIQRRIEMLNAEITTTKLNIGRINKILPLVAEKVSSVELLLEKSMASRSQYLELKLDLINQSENLEMEKAKLLQLAAAINEEKQQQQVLKAEFQRQHSESTNQYYREASVLEQELIKASTTNSQQQLLAPVNGTVEQLILSTVGGVVTSAQELMRIVPSDQELIAEVWLLNKDIGFVELGQKAEIKLESFEFTKYGVIDGEVIEISTDAVEREGFGLVFSLKVKLDKHSIYAGDRNVSFGSGMAVTVEVQTGKRRIIEFLLSPLMKSVKEGVRER